jgi:hypothetical protein
LTPTNNRIIETFEHHAALKKRKQGEVFSIYKSYFGTDNDGFICYTNEIVNKKFEMVSGSSSFDEIVFWFIDDNNVRVSEDRLKRRIEMKLETY